MDLLVVPKQTRQSEYIYLKHLITINDHTYRWLVKVMSSKSINFFCYHISREKNVLIDFLLNKITK